MMLQILPKQDIQFASICTMQEGSDAVMRENIGSIQSDFLSKVFERLDAHATLGLWYALQSDEIKARILESRELRSWCDYARYTSPVPERFRGRQERGLIASDELEAREGGWPVATWTTMIQDVSDQNLLSLHVNAPSADRVVDESASLRPPSRPGIPSAVFEFATGVDGARPSIKTFLAAANIVMAVNRMVDSPDVDFDDSDGSLSFDFRLSSGYLALADLDPDGSLDASIYDSENQRVRRMPEATDREFIESLREYDADPER